MRTCTTRSRKSSLEFYYCLLTLHLTHSYPPNVPNGWRPEWISPREDAGSYMVEAREEPIEGSAVVLSLQPHPISTAHTYFRTGSRVITSIARRWKEGDSGEGGRCRLCEECSATDGLCIIIAGFEIPSSACPLFSTRGLREQGCARRELVLARRSVQRR